MKIFDSRNLYFRSPIGATKEETKIHFKIVLPRSLCCSKAELNIYTDNNHSLSKLSMFWCGMNKESYEEWECHYTPKEPGIYWYKFELSTTSGTKEISKSNNSSIGVLGLGEPWQLTVYSKDFKTPQWLKGGIMYQIFPDRFYCSKKEKNLIPEDRIIRNDWEGIPNWKANKEGKVTNSDYFCGDLEGISQKLEYLSELGVSCIYLNPIFEAHSNHRYNTADYSKIDPLLGTDKYLKSLCKKAKRLGINIILDGVFSHTGSDSIYFNRERRYPNCGAYNSKDSDYYSWYNFTNWPNQYNSWWGFNTLPEVNEADQSYNQYINGKDGIIRKWLRCGISGWRLDVADELPDCFIENVREAAKEENKDALILGEVWEDASNKISYGHRRKFLLGNQLDSVMNYPFRNAIIGFLNGLTGYQVAEIILNILENYPKQVVDILMNPIGTHDTERIITALAGKKINNLDKEAQAIESLTEDEINIGVKLVKIASAMQYTLPGVPCIYYGDEAGLQGYSDPFNRRCYPWKNENKELIEWYKYLGKMRKNSKSLVDGEFILSYVDNSVISYFRKNDDETLFCGFNVSKNDIEIEISNKERIKVPKFGCVIYKL